MICTQMETSSLDAVSRPGLDFALGLTFSLYMGWILEGCLACSSRGGETDFFSLPIRLSCMEGSRLSVVMSGL